MRLTDRQREIFEWVLSYQALYCCSPSLREIARQHHITWQVAQQHIGAIVHKGYLEPITNAEGQHRGWRAVPVG